MYGVGVGIFRFKDFAYLANKIPNPFFLGLIFQFYSPNFQFLTGASGPWGDCSPPPIGSFWVMVSSRSLSQAANVSKFFSVSMAEWKYRNYQVSLTAFSRQ